MTAVSSSIVATCNGSIHAGIPTMFVDPVEDLAAFDELPWPIRQALDFHPIKRAAAPVLALWSDPEVLPDFDCIERVQIFLAELASASLEPFR